MYILVNTCDAEVESVLMGTAGVVSNAGEFLMVETMISNRSKLVSSVRVVVCVIAGVDVMAGAGGVISVTD